MQSVFSVPVKPQGRSNTLTFTMAPTHVAYANTLRRLCMTGVETVGFRADILDNGKTTDIEVQENTTPMTNEMLAHRIGLIPIHVENPLEWDKDKYTFILDKKNTKEETMHVFASDFRVLEKKGDEIIATDSSVFFKNNPVTQETCLIATLKPFTPGGKEEEIKIQAKATIGTGLEDARFIPTSQCAYSYTLDKNPERLLKTFENWILEGKKAPSIDELKKDQNKYDTLMREFNTLQVNRCYLIDDETGEPNSFDFTIESVGILKPEYIVSRACEVGVNLCKKYAVNILPPDVVVQNSETYFPAFDFIFQKQDDTLGHLIQAWIDENRMNGTDITFVGYSIPHPLRKEMVIRIGVRDGKEEKARTVLREAMMACSNMFQQWKSEWDTKTTGQPQQVTTKSVAQPSTSTQAPKRKLIRPSQKPTVTSTTVQSAKA